MTSGAGDTVGLSLGLLPAEASYAERARIASRNNLTPLSRDVKMCCHGPLGGSIRSSGSCGAVTGARAQRRGGLGDTQARAGPRPLESREPASRGHTLPLR